MTFRAERDRFFILTTLLIVLVTATVIFIPLLFDKSATQEDWIIVSCIFLGTNAFVLWPFLFITYTFHEEYLQVAGGPVRSKIKYRDITKVARTTDILTGYRMHSSLNSIEIFYNTGWTGSVKISPQQQEWFMEELKKRCPNMILDLK
ncbi:PH domain-containing protein [Fictibacillus iocasae]|uniref:PH domain-containing protein n=1 Tax=Fictibacillus iocasae TaxID=2715437 RepID=A0ABW2NXW8_9BACL